MKTNASRSEENELFAYWSDIEDWIPEEDDIANPEPNRVYGPDFFPEFLYGINIGPIRDCRATDSGIKSTTMYQKYTVKELSDVDRERLNRLMARNGFESIDVQYTETHEKPKQAPLRLDVVDACIDVDFWVAEFWREFRSIPSECWNLFQTQMDFADEAARQSILCRSCNGGTKWDEGKVWMQEISGRLVRNYNLLREFWQKKTPTHD